MVTKEGVFRPDYMRIKEEVLKQYPFLKEEETTNTSSISGVRTWPVTATVWKEQIDAGKSLINTLQFLSET